nr:glycerol-3-phosphate 1-O-acyltransferase PlsY [Candidatus Pacearchaeota archaeon]
FGYIIAKKKNIDITKQGSGNIGATNVSRSLGPKYALLVAVLDILKALLPMYIASYYISNDWHMLFVIIAPMIGHIFPIWLNFKGGKAVSTVFAAIFYIAGWKALPFLVIWAIMLKLIKIMSLTNLIIILFVPIWFWIETHSLPYLYLGLFCVIMIYWTHRENIKRLIEGNEKKIVK